MVRLKTFISNERGLTLIELLASIIILSIVILTFLSFFTNAFRFNAINSDSIQAMNIAREQQAMIKENDSDIHQLLVNNSLTAEAAIRLHVNNSIEKTEKNGKDYYILKSTNTDYDITIAIEKDTHLTETFNDLHEVHVEVKKNGKLLSETYTYFESKREVS